MQAIILAGGFGTRLKGVVSDLPKPMAPIRGVPFLSYILNQLDNNGFTKVILAVGYMGDKIQEFYGLKYKNIDIAYSYEDSPLGTGGCVVKSLDLVDDKYVFIINGDTYFDIDFTKLTQPKNVKIVCKYINNVSRYGKVIFDKNHIVTAFMEKGTNVPGYINGGIYYIYKNVFKSFIVKDKFSLEKDFFEKFIKQLNIEVYISEGYFIDIGIPEDYKRAQNEL